MNDRKLSYIANVSCVEPIPNADAIECITINGGWKCVAKKNEFKVNDSCVYFEIDSMLPLSNPAFTFLNKGSTLIPESKHRLRTIRLKGQLSQGLALPISIANGHTDNLDEYFGITKYEPNIPAQLQGLIRGTFPSCIPKTDQERIQNLSNKIDSYKEMQFEVTEKLDGCSFTAALIADEFHVCSRNMDLKYTEDNVYWKMAIKYDLENVLRKIKKEFSDYEFSGYEFAIQGEIVGLGVQGNKYKMSDIQFFVYDIFNITVGKYLSSEARLSIVKEFNLQHVPVLEIIENNFVNNENNYIHDVSDYLDYAEGKSVLNNTVEREGVVFKNTTKTDIHFKAISNKFLEKYKE